LRHWLKENPVDLICSHDYKASFYSLAARINNSLKVVGFSRGATAENTKVKFYMWLDSQLLKYCDRIVAVSRSQAKLLSSKGIERLKIHVIENAVTSNAFQSLDQSQSTNIREELGLPADNIIILSAGRLSIEKGHRYLIQAFSAIANEYPNCQLILAGDGPLTDDLKSLSAENDSEERIHFLGFRTDIDNLYEQSDIMVLPSLSEGLPNAVLEAMSSQCAVIASNVGGVPDIIEHQVNGLLVAAADVEGLTSALASLIPDAVLRSTLETQAAGTIAENYSPIKQTEALTQLYVNVVYHG